MSRLLFAGILFLGAMAGAENRPDVQRAVMIHMGSVKKCYNEVLKTTPKPKDGKITVEWAVDEQGAASKITVNAAKSTLRDPHLESCLIAKVKTWKLPHSPKGKLTYVSFPFYFNHRASLKPRAKASQKTKH